MKKMNNWVPVSERLPKEFEKVLLSIKNMDGERIVEAGFYNSIGKYWELDIEVAVPALCEGEIVEAWQPMPEPWKGEGK